MNVDLLSGNDFNSYGSENFKGRRGGNGGSGTGAAMGALAAGAVLGSSGSNGEGNMQRCPLTDQSFYCQLSRTTNIVSMLIFLFVVIISAIGFIYFVYQYMNSRKKSSGKK